MKYISRTVLLFSILTAASTAIAKDQVGTLTQVSGSVMIFTAPSKLIKGPSPRVKWDGEYFTAQEAKPGDRVERGNLVRTLPGAKAKVVFDNGDQINLGPGSAYRIEWNEDSPKGRTEIELKYGKLRGIIEKGGPRSRLKVRTRAAVMGVRGTDFFIADNGTEAGTEIAVLRGEVAVAPALATQEPVPVKAGFSAEIPAPPATAASTPTNNASPLASNKIGESTTPAQLAPQKIELRRTTQEELTGIQKTTQLKSAVKATESVGQEVAAKLAVLEKKAVETTLNDIKAADPKLFAKLQEKPSATTEELDTQAVEVLIQEAPKAPPKRKPYQSELQADDDDAYKRYLKTLE
jgi:hypothetical protein